MTAMTAIGNAREGDGDHVAVLQRVLRADEGWSSRERIALTAAIAAMQAQQGAEPVAVVTRGSKRAHVVWIDANESSVPDRATLYIIRDPSTGAPR